MKHSYQSLKSGTKVVLLGLVDFFVGSICPGDTAILHKVTLLEFTSSTHQFALNKHHRILWKGNYAKKIGEDHTYIKCFIYGDDAPTCSAIVVEYYAAEVFNFKY